MFIPKRPTKRQRLAAILDGLPDPPELPPEAEGISMVEDGAVLHGTGWVRPSDYQDDDDQVGLLPAWKGITPLQLPTLTDQNHPAEG